MFLSDADIVKYLESGIIKVFPQFQHSDLRQCDLRVHLSNEIYELSETDIVIDLRDEKLSESVIRDTLYRKVSFNESADGRIGYVLSPNKSVIASTVESFVLPNNMFILLDGRSTLARLGITIHISASIIDSLNLQKPKRITLEIFNLGKHKIMLYNTMPIGMVLFGVLSSDSVSKPSEHYTGEQVLPNLKYIRDNGIL